MRRSLFIPIAASLFLAGCNEASDDNVDPALRERTAATQTQPKAHQPSPGAPAAISLDRALTFADPAQCRPSPELRRVLERMLVRDEARGDFRIGGAVSLAGLEGSLMPRLTVTPSTQDGLRMIDYQSSLQLPNGSRWHGLRVSRIAVTYLEVDESDDQEQTSIDFLEPPATVRRFLNQREFNVPVAPGYSELHDHACGGAMQIVTIAGGAALQCGYGC